MRCELRSDGLHTVTTVRFSDGSVRECGELAEQMQEHGAMLHDGEACVVTQETGIRQA